MRQGSFQPCPAQDGASSMAGSSGRDLAHLLTLVLLLKEWWQGLAIFRGGIRYDVGQVPCEFQADWPTFIFQPVTPHMIWHIYSYLYCSSRDSGRDLPSSGEAYCMMLGRSPVSFEQIGQPSFFSWWLLM